MRFHEPAMSQEANKEPRDSNLAVSQQLAWGPPGRF